MEIKEIIKKYQESELNNNIDEKYAGGFWDLAGDIVSTYQNRIMETGDIDDLQDIIYQNLTELYRELTKKRNELKIKIYRVKNVENNEMVLDQEKMTEDFIKQLNVLVDKDAGIKN